MTQYALLLSENFPRCIYGVILNTTSFLVTKLESDINAKDDFFLLYSIICKIYVKAQYASLLSADANHMDMEVHMSMWTWRNTNCLSTSLLCN